MCTDLIQNLYNANKAQYQKEKKNHFISTMAIMHTETQKHHHIKMGSQINNIKILKQILGRKKMAAHFISILFFFFFYFISVVVCILYNYIYRQFYWGKESKKKCMFLTKYQNTWIKKRWCSSFPLFQNKPTHSTPKIKKISQMKGTKFLQTKKLFYIEWILFCLYFVINEHW